MAISQIQQAALASGVPSSVASAALPAGSVLQVVNATYSTLASSTSSTYADTGLSASITPKFSTSKILVMIGAAGCAKQTGNTGVGLRILRGSTTILNFEGGICYSGNSNYLSASASTSYLDSPATTSATTYKLQFNSINNVSIAYVNDGNGNQNSTITLMEIAQ
jgi:hypothetical protein